MFATQSVIHLADLFSLFPNKKNPSRASASNNDELETLGDALQQIELGNLSTLDQAQQRGARSR